MRRLRLKGFCVRAVVWAFTFAACSAWALDKPRDAERGLKLAPGEFIVSDSGELFELDDENEVSIEFWFRVEEELPLPFQQKILLWKPPSWGLILRRRGGNNARHDRPPRITIQPQLWTSLTLLLLPLDMWVIPVEDDDFILSGWHHLRIDTWREEEARHFRFYLDGTLRFANRWSFENDRTERHSLVYIGDAPDDVLLGTDLGELPYGPVARVPMEFDELRVSRVVRGEPADSGLKTRPMLDEHTLALWRFDEPGLNRTFMSVGSEKARFHQRTIDLRERLVTAWGQLKRVGP